MHSRTLAKRPWNLTKSLRVLQQDGNGDKLMVPFSDIPNHRREVCPYTHTYMHTYTQVPYKPANRMLDAAIADAQHYFACYTHHRTTCARATH
jgi:hypothetical protein